MKNKKAYIWNTLGKFIPQGLYLLTTLILARFLTPEEFGKIGVLTVFLTIANTLMDAGFGGSLINEKKTSLLDYSTIFVFNISISTLIYLILFCTAPYIELEFKTKGLAEIMRWLCLVFLINAWGIVPNTILIRDLRFKTIMQRNIISTIIAAIVGIVMAFYKFGSYAIVGYQLIYAISCVSQNYWYTKYKISLRFSILRFRHLFSFGFFTTICNVIDSIYENIMTFLFGRYLSVQQAGYLDQAQKLESTATQTLTTTINNVSFPILVKLRDEKEIFIKECDNISITVICLIFPLLSVIAIYSNDIIKLLYGNEWLPASKYLTILIYAGYFIIIEYLYRNFLKSYNQVKILLTATLIKRLAGISIILLSVIFCENYAVWGYVISSLIGAIVNSFVFSKSIGISMVSALQRVSVYLILQLGLLIILNFIYILMDQIFLSFLITIILGCIYYSNMIMHLKKQELL